MAIRHFIVPILWTLLILLLYGIHAEDIPDSDIWDLFSIDKYLHAFVFMVNVHAWAVAFKKQVKWDKVRNKFFKYALTGTLFLGVVLELFQGMVFASRTTEVLDLVANVIGAFLGLLMFRIVYGKDMIGKKTNF